MFFSKFNFLLAQCPGSVLIQSSLDFEQFIESYPACIELDSSFRIVNAVDLYSLEGLKLQRIHGDLIIENSSVENLNGFEQLESVGGELIIDNNDDLIEINNLPKLESIGGSFTIKGNDRMRLLRDLDHLLEVGSLKIENNKNLLVIDTFSQLVKIKGDSFISNNKNLILVNCFPVVDSLLGKLTVNLNPNMSAIVDFQNLKFVEKLLFFNNFLLSEISGFNALEEIAELAFIQNPSLSELQAFESLQRVNGDFEIRASQLSSFRSFDNLTVVENDFVIQGSFVDDIDGFEKLDSVGRTFLLSQNHSLDTISGFNNLHFVGKHFSLDNLGSKIRSLDNFHSLEVINDGLVLSNIPNLISLDGLVNLRHTERIKLEFLANLNSIQALSNIENELSDLIITDVESLTSLQQIANLRINDQLGKLTIIRNDVLADCATPAICSFIQDEEHVVFIDDNIGGCMNEIAVLNSCNSTSNTRNTAQKINEFLIVPNPVVDYLKIDNDINFKFEIIDLHGRIHSTGNCIGGSQIDVTNLENGLYVLMVLINDYWHSKKFLKI